MRIRVAEVVEEAVGGGSPVDGGLDGANADDLFAAGAVDTSVGQAQVPGNGAPLEGRGRHGARYGVGDDLLDGELYGARTDEEVEGQVQREDGDEGPRDDVIDGEQGAAEDPADEADDELKRSRHEVLSVASRRRIGRTTGQGSSPGDGSSGSLGALGSPDSSSGDVDAELGSASAHA